MALAQHQGAAFIGLVLGFQFPPSSRQFKSNTIPCLCKSFLLSANNALTFDIGKFIFPFCGVLIDD
jgi:hypothetical protein